MLYVWSVLGQDYESWIGYWGEDSLIDQLFYFEDFLGVDLKSFLNNF